MDFKNTTKTAFNKVLEPIKSKRFTKYLKTVGVDRYIKKFFCFKFLSLMIYAQFNQLSSLREISDCLENEDLQKIIGLTSISPSQISRKLKDFNPEIAQQLFKDIVRQVRTELGTKGFLKALGPLSLIDSTTISLCLTQYPWADFRKSKSGVKLHLRLNYIDGNTFPDEAVVTIAKRADKTMMKSLVDNKENVFNVFDRAYLDYEKFDEYCEKEILFATRLKKNAIKEVVGQNPLTDCQNIKNDSVVILGRDGTTKMDNPLRCIKAIDLEGKEIEIITNNFEASAEEIGDIYRHRWQIEIFFKWIKQHLQVKHFHSLAQQAVETQLHIALITYCLLKIVKLRTSYTGSLLKIERLLKACFHEPFSCFIKKLYKKPKHSSRGRPKEKHEIVFKMLEWEVMENGTDHLDDLTYDPIIL